MTTRRDTVYDRGNPHLLENIGTQTDGSLNKDTFNLISNLLRLTGYGCDPASPAHVSECMAHDWVVDGYDRVVLKNGICTKVQGT